MMMEDIYTLKNLREDIKDLDDNVRVFGALDFMTPLKIQGFMKASGKYKDGSEKVGAVLFLIDVPENDDKEGG